MSRWPKALTPLVFLALALAWTWPAPMAPAGWLVGLHFDLPGTVWFIDAAPRMGLDLHDPLTGWPEGVTYRQPDSYVLLALSALLSWLPAHAVHGLLQVVGVTLSAWAAEAFARELGARPPWSLVAGLAFGFSGLAATALLEGHVYHALNPWLPLFGLWWLRATSRGGRWHQGLLAGLFFCLTTLTTAYLGLAAAVVAVGFAVGGLVRTPRRFPWAAALSAAAVVGAFSAWYLSQFQGGGLGGLPGYDSSSRQLFLLANSADIAGLASPTASVDRFAHAKAATLPLTALMLAALAPVVLRRADGRWKVVLLTGLAALLLSMGPWLHLGDTWIPLPLVMVADMQAADLLRHPARLGWGALLAFGAVGAVVATRLGDGGRKAWPILVFVLLDAFVVVGLPFRQGRRPATTPSAYLQDTTPVFDLYPTQPGLTYELNGWFQAMACQHQIGHGRAIADNCVVTRADENPRVGQSQVAIGLLLEGDVQQALRPLRDRRFEALAFHPDFFAESDRLRIRAALEQVDPAPVVSDDGGQRVEVYQLGGSASGHGPIR